MSDDPRDVVDDRFRESWEEEDTTVPAAPSRPADESFRIMGMAPDTYALMVDRKIDAYAEAQTAAIRALSENFGAVQKEIRDGFRAVLDKFKVQETHGQQIAELRADVNKLVTDVAELAADVEKQKAAAKKRLRGKR